MNRSIINPAYTLKLLIFLALFSVQLTSFGQDESIFELGRKQSMSITGKGPGQDAAINPYIDEISIATVKSLSENPFTIRLQSDGEIIETVTVNKSEQKEIILKPGVVLYLDSEKKTKAQVTFRKYE